MTIVIRKRKNDNSTLRKLYNLDGTECYGLMGTVGDLLKEEIFEFCVYDQETWCYIPNGKGNVQFAKERDELITYIKEEVEQCIEK